MNSQFYSFHCPHNPLSSEFVFSAVLLSATWPTQPSQRAWKAGSKELDFAVLWGSSGEQSVDYKTCGGFPNLLVLTEFLTGLLNTPRWMTRETPGTVTQTMKTSFCNSAKCLGPRIIGEVLLRVNDVGNSRPLISTVPTHTRPTRLLLLGGKSVCIKI